VRYSIFIKGGVVSAPSPRNGSGFNPIEFDLWCNVFSLNHAVRLPKFNDITFSFHTDSMKFLNNHPSKKAILTMAISLLCASSPLFASDDPLALHEDIPRPEQWSKLTHGGRFMDLILPAPIHLGLETDTWGAEAVRPRDIHNGIEDPEWSYWGGRSILEPDGTYHLFICRWREDDPRGHDAWPSSQIVHATSKRPTGPFEVLAEVGPGHFPEIHRLPDGTYAIYHFHGAYLSEDIHGPWKHVTREDFGFPDILFGSMDVREDGSLLMMDRIQRVLIKEKDSDKFVMVNGKEVIPERKPKYAYEDPMIWKTEVQYHLIVNDWHGRVASHLRSKDGVHWKEDPGEAYTIDFDRYEDSTKVGWYKYERCKVVQDQHGRPTHLHFAVIDVPKKRDLTKDGHSSKNIVLPLVVERRLEMLDPGKVTDKTKEIRLLIKAEAGFDPRRDVDVESLRFGASEAVDYGGGCKAVGSAISGNDLVVTFDASGHGFTSDNFAGKLLGKDAKGKLLYGYSRLPWVDYSPYVIDKSGEGKGKP